MGRREEGGRAGEEGRSDDGKHAHKHRYTLEVETGKGLRTIVLDRAKQRIC